MKHAASLPGAAIPGAIPDLDAARRLQRQWSTAVETRDRPELSRKVGWREKWLARSVADLDVAFPQRSQGAFAAVSVLSFPELLDLRPPRDRLAGTAPAETACQSAAANPC